MSTETPKHKFKAGHYVKTEENDRISTIEKLVTVHSEGEQYRFYEVKIPLMVNGEFIRVIREEHLKRVKPTTKIIPSLSEKEILEQRALYDRMSVELCDEAIEKGWGHYTSQDIYDMNTEQSNDWKARNIPIQRVVWKIEEELRRRMEYQGNYKKIKKLEI